MEYKDAGVDVEAGRAFVRQLQTMVKRTYRSEVLGGLGGFSGLFQVPDGYQEPVLVSGTDGVGTKLKLAQILNIHNTIGIDLVAMCVNDVLTAGAEPLFFLDYLATGQLRPEQMKAVVAGIAEGCQQAGCALLGGETAEMPGFYQVGEYDLAGFCVGIVEKSQLLDGSRVQVGDVAIGLASRGVHSNGFSLVRKIVRDRGFQWSDRPDLLSGQSLGEALLAPTQIYVQPVLALQRAGFEIHSMAHITGGGLPENLPRCLKPDRTIQINLNTWNPPPIFQWLAAVGKIEPAEMFNTFNMGIGFVLVTSSDRAEPILEMLASQNTNAWIVGEVISDPSGVTGLPGCL